MRCVRSLLRALAALVFAASLRGAEAPRVAIMDFGLAETAGSREAEIANFSRDVQARLLIHNEFSWVERQEFDRIEREIDLAGLARVDAASAVRLGHWLHADLLLRGEIARPAAGSAELTFEVIDLNHAELLATRKTTVTVSRRNLVAPTPADVDAAATAALAALNEAAGVLAGNRNVRLIAPLFFCNSGPTERLNFLEPRLLDALTKAVSPATGRRLLRFPQANEAGDEAGMVFAGLTDADPDAWQRIADFFVWGAFSEGNSEGVAFEKVPVTIAIQVWSGVGAPRAVRWEGPVRSLDQGVRQVIDGVMELTKDRPATAERNEADRKRLVTELAARRAEARSIFSGLKSHSYQAQLLKITCLFDPLNRECQSEQLQVRLMTQDPHAPTDTFPFCWRQFALLESFARRFERKPDGSFDWILRAHAVGPLESIFTLMRSSTVGKGDYWTMPPEEKLRQYRFAVRLWCREIAAANRLFSGKAVPEELEAYNRDWLRILRGCLDFDAIVARNAVEEVWPWLKKAAGRELRERPDSDLPATLFSVYAAFGDVARASAMLDDACQAAGGEPTQIAPTKAPTSPAEVPRPEKPWVSAQPAAAGSSPPAPPLEAAVREIDLWPANVYFEHSQDRPLTKQRWPRVTSLAWHRGELWVGQTLVRAGDRDALPFASDNYLWRYDPALQTADLTTKQLGAHSAVRALISQPEHLWLGLASEGVWQWPAGQSEVRRFRGEDGLATSQIYAAAAGRRTLFFMGGTGANRLIAYYSADAGSWFVVREPYPLRSERFSGDTPKPYAPEIAVCGDWIAVITPHPAFYNPKDKAWTMWPGEPTRPTNGPTNMPTKPPVWTGPRGPTGIPIIPRPPGATPYTCLSADESGFWLGSENAILQIDPQAPEKKRLIRLPGTPVAAAHDGARLWLVLEAKDGDPKLALLDKNSGQCTGLLTLPVADLHLQVSNTNLYENRIAPEELHFDRIAVAEGRVWVGGPGLFEVTLREAVSHAAGTSVSADHLLHRAAWHGDLAATEEALAAKADVNAASASGWTPLLAAVDGGQESVVRALLRAGAKPNHLSHSGRSPLELAAARGDLSLVRLLLESGATPDLNPGVIVRGLGQFLGPVEPIAPNLDATVAPNQPTNLRARLTEDGRVALSWDNRSDNESVFRIVRADSRAVPKRGIADVPAGTQNWIDETPPPGAEVGYRVYALNGANPSVPYDDEPAVWLKVPAEPPARVILWTVPPKPLPSVVESQTPLRAAAKNGHLPVVQALLAAKASPDLRDPVGQTALLLAVRSGHYEVARALLAAGAHADLADATGRTAAQAVYKRHEDEALWREMLSALDSGRRAREASRLIWFAAGDGQVHDLETLRDLGGNSDATTREGYSALSFALTNRQPQAVAWLLKHGYSLHRKIWAWNGIRPRDPSALTDAIETGDRRYLAAFLDAGISANETIGGLPLLAHAAKLEKPDVVTLLIERGADLNLKSTEGKSAANYANSDALRTLFARKPAATWSLPRRIEDITGGPKVVAPEPDPAKAALNVRLIEACRRDDCDGVAAAVAEGAEINMHDDTGMRPLTHALKARAFRAARWLVENGAAVNLPSRSGFCPLAFAVETRQLEIVNYLLDQGADPNTHYEGGYSPLLSASYADDSAIALRLLDAGADPNLASWANNKRRVGPLAIALRKGSVPMVELLLSRGANPKAQGYLFALAHSGVIRLIEPSLLMYAAAGGNVDLIRRMIAAGQDPRLTTHDGYDALAWAASQGQEAAVEFLLPLVDHSPHALESAREGGHARVVERLRRAGYQ